MKSGIDTLAEHQIWSELYKLLPDSKRVAYFCPEYYFAYKAVEDYPTYCFWRYQDDENFLFYPFLKKGINSLGYSLDKEYYDICGAYGYNGPIGVVKDSAFLQTFNSELLAFFASQDVVTEFVRYCPIPDNKMYHIYPQQIDVLDNVYVDLSLGVERLWFESYEKNLRTSIRKGSSYGLRSLVYQGTAITKQMMRLVYDIYSSTMQRNNADQFYYFGLDFLDRLLDIMGTKLHLVITYHESTPISFELLICDGVLSYAILGGTVSSYYFMNPNTYQKNELFISLIQRGLELYSMGGGVRKSDNLYSYKKSFNKKCKNPFYIGTKVHLPDVYEDILTQWKAKYPQAAAKYAGKLQGYRQLA